MPITYLKINSFLSQLLPKMSWSFNKSPVHMPQNQPQSEVAAIPQPPPLSSWNENE